MLFSSIFYDFQISFGKVKMLRLKGRGGGAGVRWQLKTLNYFKMISKSN